MTTNLSPKDWQALSAYLDGQLSQQEQARLEKRLGENPVLQTGLAELRQTRTILRGLPKRKAPRNFYLSPAMVKPRPVPLAAPALGFASAFSAFLFLLVLAGQVFLRSAPAASTSMIRITQQVEKAAAPQAVQALPEIITWGTPTPLGYSANSVPGYGGGGIPAEGIGGGAPEIEFTVTPMPPAATQASSGPSLMAQPQPTRTDERLVTPPTATPEAPQPTDTTEPTQTSPAPTATPTPPAPVADQLATAGNPILGLETGQRELQSNRQATSLPPGAVIPPALDLSRIALLLAIASIASALAAFWIYRKSR